MKNLALGCLSVLALSAGCKQREYNESEENSLRSASSDKRIAVDVLLQAQGTDARVRLGCAWEYRNNSKNLSQVIQPLNPYPFDANVEGFEALAKTGAGVMLLGIAQDAKLAVSKGAAVGFGVIIVSGVYFLVSAGQQGLDAFNKSATLKKAFNDVTVSETQFLAAAELLKKSGNRIHGAICKPKTLQQLKALDSK